MLTLAPAGSARAETLGCEHTWHRLAAWSEREATRGLTTEALEALQVLIPELESCGEGPPGATSSTGEGVERWRDLAAVYFAPDELDRVLCLMAKESGGDPDARNTDSGASGLMQVMPSWAPVFGYEPEDLYDPIVNLWIAGQIRQRQGWGAWTPYLRGSCR
ncbi:MAG: transglycosylase SLT domain-containing protein [Acidimicrobiia bacterium]